MLAHGPSSASPISALGRWWQMILSGGIRFTVPPRNARFTVPPRTIRFRSGG